ncbi:hypothetical protein V6N13_029543 [Hibiscus sabdariffa]
MKRVNISRFSGSGVPIKQFLPICLLSCQPVFSHADMKGCIDEIVTATKFWFSEHKDRSFLPSEGEDAAIWLLVSTNSDAQHELFILKHCTFWAEGLLMVYQVAVFRVLQPMRSGDQKLWV